MRKLLLYFFVLFNCQARAQTACDSLTTAGFIDGAIRSLSAGRTDSLNYYSHKIKVCHDLGAWMRLHRSLGVAYRNQKNYEAALAAFRLALEGGLGKPGNDNEYLELAKIYANIGYIYKKLNDQQAIVQYYEKAVAVFTDTLKLEDAYVAKTIYSELGNAYNRLRDYDKAAFYHKRRKDILLNAQQWDDAAGAYNDLGMVYLKQQDLEQAIDAFSEGLAIGAAGFDNKVLLLFNLGYTFLNKGDLKKALEYTRQCEKFVLDSDIPGLEKTQQLIWVYDNFAKYYKLKKDYTTSERYYSRRIEMVNTADLKDSRSLALAFVSRGNMYLEWDKPEKALNDFRTALQHLLPGLTAGTPYSLPSKEQLVAEPTLIDALGGLAQCLGMLYQRKPSGELATKAATCFDLAGTVESLLLQFYLLEESQLKALREHRWIKSAQMSFVFDRWTKEQYPGLAEEMFSISEQSRALLLLEGMERSKVLQTDDLETMRTEYRAVNQDIEKIEQRLHELQEEPDIRLAGSLEMQLLRKKAKKADLLKRTTPNLPGQRDPARFATVKQGLKADEALIEYFIQYPDAYIFILDPKFDRPAIIKTTWNAELALAATTLREDIFNQNNTGYIQKARQLYEHLVKPVLELTNAGHLIIIPDGEIWNVPFDALLTRDIEEKDWRNFKGFPYLLEEKRISYGFSATLQLGMCNKKGNASGKKLLAFAPSYRPTPANINKRSQIGPLLYNVSEAKEITRIGNGEYISGSDASKGRFLQMVSRAGILHLAAHAKANHQNPELSFIAFSNIGDTLRGSYRLYAYELANHLEDMDMAVLSACETGTGRLWQGEGMLSLARVFASKGARSIITTLWSIDDEATKDIMVAFYQNLKQEQTKDQALREAKRTYIRQAPDNDRAHPRYWAAFTPLGNMEPVQWAGYSRAKLLTGVFVCGLMLIAGLFGWRILRRRAPTQ